VTQYAERLQPVINRLVSGTWTRFVAFGSSNTERFIGGVHWLDWLELGIKHSHGRIAHFINAGLGGDTSRGLLGRFDNQVAVYSPDVVIITIGGNDAGTDTGITAAEFKRNMTTLVELTKRIGAYPVLQTYYAQQTENDLPKRVERFLEFMQILRDVAADTSSGLVDHLSRWDVLRLRKPKLYATLMRDPHHLNDRGNEVFGVDLIRAFELKPVEELLELCEEGTKIQELMDGLQVTG
jgi:lysophospholipase L1-like esterase